jgi:hypothetical protein
MQFRTPPIYVAVFIGTVIVACSVLKSENSDKEILEFLSKLQADLKLPAREYVAKHFKTTNQSHETIIQAIRVLQNTDTLGLLSSADFQNPHLTRYETRTEVKIPVKFSLTIDNESIERQTNLILWLDRRNEEFVIVEIDGEQFYQTYTELRNEKVWSAARKQELKNREPIYTTARELEKTLDSVIWYAEYNNELYFYAVRGTWKNSFNGDPEYPVSDYKMGLVNSKGDTLIPFEYEMIGTIGFAFPDMIEVKRNGKYGYLDLASKQFVVEPQFTMIIPYQKYGTWAMVVQDSVVGTLNKNFEFVEGYPDDESVVYYDNYQYLHKTVVLKAGNQIFCEIPSADYAGMGIIVPPSYYVKNKLFAPIIAGINTTQVPMKGWTDSIERNSMFSRIGDNIRALISVVSERYIGGREEFYGESSVTFVNETDQVLAETRMPTDQEIYFNHVDEYTIELRATATGYHYYVPGNERDIPVYKYFRMGQDNSLQELTSTRIFPFTEYVKIDSSYLEGPFSMYAGYVENEEEPAEESYEETSEDTATPEEVDAEPTDGEAEAAPDESVSDEPSSEEQTDDSEQEEVSEEEYVEYEEDYEEPVYVTVDFLSLPTISLIRDEILAAYGVAPSNNENRVRLVGHGHILTDATRDDVETKMSEIDRHNLAFLEKVMSLMQGGL